jgi:hypothetical protein
MSREVKRVPFDFDGPVGQVWEGYLSHHEFPACEACDYSPPSLMAAPFPRPRQGTGYTREAWAIASTFYPFQIIAAEPGRTQAQAEKLAWHDKLDQAEVDHLVAHGYLRVWKDGRRQSVPRLAAEVNQAERDGPARVHDAGARAMLVEFRCKRLGIPLMCRACGGHGTVATARERAAEEAWEPTEPPPGEGWQLWETVTAGSPLSPVFSSALELARWMSSEERGQDWMPADMALKFIGDGWAPTLVSFGGEVVSGQEAAGRSGHCGPCAGEE